MPGSTVQPEGSKPGDRSGCLVCGAARRPGFRAPTDGPADLGSADLRPTSAAFGRTLGRVRRCVRCGHGSVVGIETQADLDRGYAHVDDLDDADEEAGRRSTAGRDLETLLPHLGTAGGRLVDVGCWTGALVAEASAMGWRAEGIEPSANAAASARSQGRDVRQAVIGSSDGLPNASFRVVTCCDVLEHLLDPADAVERIVDLLEPGGVLFATVPDFGSVVARVLGRRWWSVLPMHVQYFTRSSLDHLLRSAGLQVLSMTTHAKVFTRRYYADRFGEFIPVVGPPVARSIGRRPWADRPMTPDFRDRIAVVARKPA